MKPSVLKMNCSILNTISGNTRILYYKKKLSLEAAFFMLMFCPPAP
jgi:hypothetical protein